MFIGELIVKCVRDDQDGLFELVQPFGFKSEVAGATFTAPAGFRTDFISCPRIPFIYEQLGNRARKSGTIHDWLYTSHITSRKIADNVLREMAIQDGLSSLEADWYFLAVRAAGGSYWDKSSNGILLQKSNID